MRGTLRDGALPTQRSIADAKLQRSCAKKVRHAAGMHLKGRKVQSSHILISEIGSLSGASSRFCNENGRIIAFCHMAHRGSYGYTCIEMLASTKIAASLVFLESFKRIFFTAAILILG